MKKSIAMKWVAALRSGEYRQAQDQLRDLNNSFCCLGVLCNLHAQAHPEIAAGETDPMEYLGEDALLPGQVQNWAGMVDNEGIPQTPSARLSVEIDGHSYRSLVEANDCGADFVQIADWIEKNYKVL